MRCIMSREILFITINIVQSIFYEYATCFASKDPTIIIMTRRDEQGASL